MKKMEYETTRGYQITIRPVSPVLIGLATKKIIPPAVPTYTAELATGEIEHYEHNESTLQTDEDRRAWDKYQAQLLAYKNQTFDAAVDVILTFGVDFEMPTDSTWEDLQRGLGIDIPEDPVQKRLHYIRTVLTGSYDDLVLISGLSTKLTTVSDEEMRALGAIFRG